MPLGDGLVGATVGDQAVSPRFKLVLSHQGLNSHEEIGVETLIQRRRCQGR